NVPNFIWCQFPALGVWMPREGNFNSHWLTAVVAYIKAAVAAVLTVQPCNARWGDAVGSERRGADAHRDATSDGDGQDGRDY
ncbi:MAG: hypothetical protein J2P19_25185, partial [Pseudonocardia sp.]|nr:hypothetical protein [Pseudonocardia sp.]